MREANSGFRTASSLPFMLLLGACLVGFSLPAEAQAVPNLNIAPTCQAAKNLDDNNKSAFQTCMDEENNAKKQITRVWGRVHATDRKTCGDLAGLASPSYVELLTCLEMYNENLLTPASAPAPVPAATPAPTAGPAVGH